MVSHVSTAYFIIVSGVWLPCRVPRILLCLALSGFNGFHAPFVSVELIGGISFVDFKPCQN